MKLPNGTKPKIKQISQFNYERNLLIDKVTLLWWFTLTCQLGKISHS